MVPADGEGDTVKYARGKKQRGGSWYLRMDREILSRMQKRERMGRRVKL
jgi:hypothetical protein